MYEILYEYEEDFRKIFKVRVEFDEEMVMSDAVVRQYGGRLRQLSEQEGIGPFDRTAVASMLEYGVRQAGRRNKVTARFPELADLAREAAYIARQEGAIAGDRLSRSARARGAHRASQPDRDQDPGNDRRGHAFD